MEGQGRTLGATCNEPADAGPRKIATVPRHSHSRHSHRLAPAHKRDHSELHPAAEPSQAPLTCRELGVAPASDRYDS